MSTERRTVLAIGAHHDDIELGCGGTLAKFAREGHDVHVYIATRSGYSDPSGRPVRGSEVAEQEAERAAKILGVTLHSGDFAVFELAFAERLNTAVRVIVERVMPDTVFTHAAGDVHNDHWALARATMHATRQVPRLAMYRSNWYRGSEPFCPTLYIDVSDTFEIKLAALRAYESEMARTGGAWAEYFTNEARNNGLETGVRYAEGFQVVRWLS
jgi:LmbE family N-acetylglucosaminyl deacetylase